MPHSIVRSLRVLVAAGVIAAPVVASATTVDAIVVKYRDDALPASAAGVSDRDLAALGHLHKSALSNLGRTRDGGFRLALDPPLSLDDARAAMNKLRLNPAVLYVGIAERTPLSKSAAAAKAGVDTTRPVRALIVKYKDPDIVAGAMANRAPPAASVQLVADTARATVAPLRAMAGGAYVMQLFRPMSALDAYAAAEALENDPAIEYADPDTWKFPTLVPNDTCYPANTNPACFQSNVVSTYLSEWHLMPGGSEPGGANLPPAWDITTGSPNIYVGVIDTGFLYNHPDLAGRAIGGYDFIYDFAVANDSDPVQTPTCLQGNDPTLYNPLNPPCVSSRDSDPSDPGDWLDAADQTGNPNSWFYLCTVSPSSFHGSHTSGTIGALSNNATGIAGINWVSKIVPLRVLGKCGGYTSDIVDAITWGSGGAVAGMGANPYPARVLNLSLGGGSPCASVEQAAITGALSRGTVVAISAGNTNTDALNNSPGNCLGNITVAATQRQGIKAQYSAFGPSVEISAPGGGRNFPETPTITRDLVVSTINSGATVPLANGYIYAGYNGTSMAAPHVAGVASLMLSRNPTLTPAQVLSYMQTTARAFPVVAGGNCSTTGSNPIVNNTTTSCNCTTTLCGAGLLDAGAAVAAVPLPPVATGRQIDFNNDAKDDLVWRNSSTGAAAVWLMNGTGTLAQAVVYGGGTYAVTNTGDLNGDSKTDLIFKMPGGPTAAWLMNGTAVASSAVLLSDPNWAVARVADFNGDGKEDLLWRNTSTGQTAIWLMNGLTPTATAVIYSDPNWVATHAADFNGDGKADLVWRNTSTGQTAIWIMNGTTPTATTIILGDANWAVTHTTDLNGDGKADLVWRNASTGATALWLMNGTSMTSGATVLVSLPWYVTNVGDFNGDGKGDLVWRNTTTGQTAVWLQNGLTPTSSAVILTDLNWTVTHVADTNGDGKSDLLWRNTSSGTALWLMNGTAATATSVIFANPAWGLSPPDGF
ncbi:MAG: S8 family serine peptidase [Burkholderiales bacterium]